MANSCMGFYKSTFLCFFKRFFSWRKHCCAAKQKSARGTVSFSFFCSQWEKKKSQCLRSQWMKGFCVIDLALRHGAGRRMNPPDIWLWFLFSKKRSYQLHTKAVVSFLFSTDTWDRKLMKIAFIYFVVLTHVSLWHLTGTMNKKLIDIMFSNLPWLFMSLCLLDICLMFVHFCQGTKNVNKDLVL